MLTLRSLLAHVNAHPNIDFADAVAAAAGVGLDCAFHGLDEPGLLPVMPEWDDRCEVLARRAGGEAGNEWSPAWHSWLRAGRPGYASCEHLIDEVDDSVWDALTSSGYDGVERVVCDLTWSPPALWSLAADLCDYWAVPVPPQ